MRAAAVGGTAAGRCGGMTGACGGWDGGEIFGGAAGGVGLVWVGGTCVTGKGGFGAMIGAGSGFFSTTGTSGVAGGRKGG